MFCLLVCLLILRLATVITWTNNNILPSHDCFHMSKANTATQQFSFLNSLSPTALIITFGSKRISFSLYLAALIILAGDIELNPGPESFFNICTLNIRSLLNSIHKAAIFDIADTFHPNVLALSETWVRSSTTPSELCDATPQGYSLISQPRSVDSVNIGGGLAFLVKEPSTYNPIPSETFQTFENLAITLQTHSGKLTIFNVYRPPTSSKHTGTFSKFLSDFDSFLSSVVTIPHKYLITGDFNIPMNKQDNSDTVAFLSLLAAYNLRQLVDFPTHSANNTLDLFITSANDWLSTTVSSTNISPSDHYPIFCNLSITTEKHKPIPTTKTFRRINNIDPLDFSNDILNSPLTNRDEDELSLSDLVNVYNTTLSTLLDKHAPLITKQVSTSKSNPWFNSDLASLKHNRRKLERTWRSTHSIADLDLLREATKNYHKAIVKAKQDYHARQIQMNSSTPNASGQP